MQVAPPPTLDFPPFRLDLQDERLWHGERPVELRPKTWQLLRYLAEHPGRLLTKAELLDAVWRKVAVSEGSLNQAILELRQALGDDARKPRFIETVHRRGFRFIAREWQAPSPADARATDAQSPACTVPGRRWRGSGPLPGRDYELEQLDQLLREARGGRRQLVFVTGEPGIGKTRLVRTFLERLAEDEEDEPVWIAGGTCVELHGEGEAYLPVLEAFERLAGEIGEKTVVRILKRWAPSWLAHMPWQRLRADDSRQAPAPPSATTPTRMLREFCLAMEALSRERPLVLWLEDLHWSDLATLDLLAALAGRTEAARLLVVVTYRPVDAAMDAHPIAPLKRRLVQHHAGRELALELLDESAVRDYLHSRCRADLDPGLAALIHEQTDGSPLFMVTLVNHFVAEGWIAPAEENRGWRLIRDVEALRAAAPRSLRDVVVTQLDGMSDEEVDVLTAASVVGDTFAAQSVAAALEREVLAVEKVCGRLAGGTGFLDNAGAGHWPDGSAGERYQFHHAVFRSILYQRLASGHRQEFHHRIAARLEEGYASRLGAIGAELAMHFERGGDPERAIPHLVEAAVGVIRRSGEREAVAYFDRALVLLSTLPHSDDRDRRELAVRMQRWTKVNASTVVTDQAASLERALELCEHLGDARAWAYTLSYRTRSLIIECELEAAESLDEQRVERASNLGDPVLIAAAHSEVGDIAFYRGELDRALREHSCCLRTLEGIDPPETCRLLGHDAGALAAGHLAWTHWLQGRPDKTHQDAKACSACGEACGYPLHRTFALAQALLLERFRRDADAAKALAKSVAELTEDYGFVLPYPTVCAVSSWTLAQSGESSAAIAQLREGLAVSRRTGVRQGLSHLLATLAELELERGETKEGLAAIDEALAFVEQTGERFWEAEIHRLNGELLRLEGGGAQADACFETALGVARRQGARSLELRAATSLAQLWKNGGRQDEARALLARVYDGFTEGFDTPDLRDAKALLDSL